MRLLAITLCLLWLWVSPALSKETIRTIEGTVTKISDGDTIQVTDHLGTKVKVRLYGIDAPETTKGTKPGQLYGEEALRALQQKIHHKQVRIDVLDIDKYRRLVAVVRLCTRDINREMIAEGNAWAYRKYLRGPLAGNYIADEEQARRQGRGLWRNVNPLPPWEFRKAQRKN